MTEICVQINGELEEIKKSALEKGFEFKESYNNYDTYYSTVSEEELKTVEYKKLLDNSVIVRNIVGDRLTESDIEEISADVFIIIWRNADKLRSESLRSYLAAVARNLSIDRLRKLHITIPIDEIEIYDNTDIEFNAEQHDLADVFNAIIDKMEQRDREILLRHYFYYQKIPQIALEMNMSQSACKTALHRARNKLKKKLIERGYGNEN
jgi:RNA polymerase sigma-70 factor (ECF subfamily)